MEIGSATSKNLFLDAGQFANRKVQVRLRNSSGEAALDVERLRPSLEGGLRQAGYEISSADAGILIDLNVYMVASVPVARQRDPGVVGALVGGVAGYEIARRPGGMSSGSGAILGAAAGATLQQVIDRSGEANAMIMATDVNIGLRPLQSSRDNFVVGGNRIADQPKPEVPFAGFSARDTVKVVVYAGSRSGSSYDLVYSMQDRLGRVVSGMF